MQNITDVNTFTSPVTVLSDGDPVVAAESIPTAQALANRTLFNASGLRLTSVVSAAGTTTLTATSTRGQVLTGSTTQIFSLPDETTVPAGFVFEFFNLSTGILTIKDSGGSTLGTITIVNGSASVISTSNGGATGGWVFQRSPPGKLLGTGTNDSAAAGEVGEYMETNGNAGSLTNNMSANACSLNLTIGDWDVTAQCYFSGTPTGGTYVNGSISATSGVSGTNEAFANTPTMPTSASSVYVTIPAVRVSLASNSTRYAVVTAGFTGGSISGLAWLHARRVR